MINFPKIPQGGASRSVQTPLTRRSVPSTAADSQKHRTLERRQTIDRRKRRGEKHVIDNRSGADRRRSSIDLSI